MRLREHLRDPLYRSAYALMASTVLTALLGVGFWALAARTASAREIGRDAVLISSLITLSSICQLNLVDALVRFLPGVRNRDRSRRIAAAYAASAAAGLLGGTAFVLGAPRVSARLAFLQGDRATAVVFVAAMGLWGIFVLQDAVLTALRRATWLPAENAAYSLAKIALLPLVLAAGSAHTVFLAWVLPTLVVVPVINILLHVRVLRPAARSAPDAAARRLELRGRGLARFMLQDYAGFVLGQSAITLVPLVVIARLGSEQSAWFYMPFTLIVAFDLLFYNVTTSMTVEGAHDEHRAPELARTVVRRFLSIQIPAALAVIVAAPVLLYPFGADYVDHGTGALRVLACASIPRAVVNLFVALARLRGRGWFIVGGQATLFLLVTVLALALARPLGLPGVALAWLVGNTVVAASAMPWLVRLLREGR